MPISAMGTVLSLVLSILYIAVDPTRLPDLPTTWNEWSAVLGTVIMLFGLLGVGGLLAGIARVWPAPPSEQAR